MQTVTNTFRVVVLSLAATLINGCSRPPADAQPHQSAKRQATQTGGDGYREARHLSLVGLIATPERFQGQLVGVKGFFRDEFEGTALYLARESYEYRLTNRVQVDVPQEWPNRAALTDKLLHRRGHRGGSWG